MGVYKESLLDVFETFGASLLVFGQQVVELQEEVDWCELPVTAHYGRGAFQFFAEGIYQIQYETAGKLQCIISSQPLVQIRRVEITQVLTGFSHSFHYSARCQGVGGAIGMVSLLEACIQTKFQE